MAPQRLRITFAKGPEIKYTSHLDLARMWERAFRRVRLPVAYSQGFNPRPKMQLASALPLGFTSRCEVLDVFLQQPIEPDEFVERLSDQLPAGLTVLAVNEVEPGGPALQSQLRHVEYRVTISANVARAEVETRIAELLAADSLPRERRGKAYDLRPLIDGLWLEGQDDDAIHLYMRLQAGPQGTGRPDQVMEALELADMVLSVERQRLEFTFDSRQEDRYNSSL